MRVKIGAVQRCKLSKVRGQIVLKHCAKWLGVDTVIRRQGTALDELSSILERSKAAGRFGLVPLNQHGCSKKL